MYLYTYVRQIREKGKGTPEQTSKPRGVRGIAIDSLDLGTRRGGWSAPYLPKH
jgi:hypothetical protein